VRNWLSRQSRVFSIWTAKLIKMKSGHYARIMHMHPKARDTVALASRKNLLHIITASQKNDLQISL
jgi:hypothetical protein